MVETFQNYLSNAVALLLLEKIFNSLFQHVYCLLDFHTSDTFPFNIAFLILPFYDVT